MLMFNGFAQIRKTCNTDHSLQYSANDNLFTSIDKYYERHSHRYHLKCRTTIPDYQERTSSYLGFVRLRTGWIKNTPLPNGLRGYLNTTICRLTTRYKWLFLRTSQPVLHLEKFPRLLLVSLNPNFCHFSQNSLFTTCSFRIPAAETYDNFWIVPINGNNLLAADRWMKLLKKQCVNVN